MIGGHLQTMERFLRSGAEVMDAYLSGAAPVLIEHARAAAARRDRAVDRGDRAPHDPALDLDHDLYLRHHTLGRAVSRTDPQLAALAVMPLAMSIEMLAEAGACLLPDSSSPACVTCARTRWLAVGERPSTVQLHARRIEPADGEHAPPSTSRWRRSTRPATVSPVDRRCRVARKRGPPRRRRRCDRRFRMRRRHAGRLTSSTTRRCSTGRSGRACGRRRGRSARRPRRRCARCREPGCCATTTTPDSCSTRCCSTLPVSSIGFWAAQRLDRAKVVFPFRMAALDLYGAAAACGRRR